MLLRVSDNKNADKKVELSLDSAHNVLAVVGLKEVRKFSRNSLRKSLHKVPLCNVLHRRRKKSRASLFQHLYSGHFPESRFRVVSKLFVR